MDEIRKEPWQAEDIPDPDEFKYLHSIESDADTLEPFEEYGDERRINADDLKDLKYWAVELNISIADLKAVISLHGNSVKEVRKILNV